MRAIFFKASERDKKATVKTSDVGLLERQLPDGTEVVLRFDYRGRTETFTGHVSRKGKTIYGAWLANLPPIGQIKSGKAFVTEVHHIEVRG